jgi:hypothetical protein
MPLPVALCYGQTIAAVPFCAIQSTHLGYVVIPFDRRATKSFRAALDCLTVLQPILLAEALIRPDPGYLFERDLYPCALLWTFCGCRFAFYHE